MWISGYPTTARRSKRTSEMNLPKTQPKTQQEEWKNYYLTIATKKTLFGWSHNLKRQLCFYSRLLRIGACSKPCNE